jgi:deoxyribonuclease V
MNNDPATTARDNMKPLFSIKKARKPQQALSKKIIREDRLPRKLRLIAGVDVAYTEREAIGAVAVLDYESMRVVETQTSVNTIQAPYIPTLLAFREMQPAIRTIRKLQSRPDIFLVDAHGLAHPSRCGFASHLGVVIQKPTIGVAKNKLCGVPEPAQEAQDVIPLKDDGEVIGAVITTKKGSKPVYVSIGHMVSLETATVIVKHCTQNSRIPEPILKAHLLATQEKRKINNHSHSTKKQRGKTHANPKTQNPRKQNSRLRTPKEGH